MAGIRSTESYENVSLPVFSEYSFKFPFEHTYHHSHGCAWMQENWHTALYYIVVYVSIIFSGQAYMKSRPRYDMKWLLFCWDASLALFSVLGTVRTFPELFFILRVHGFHHSVCEANLLDVNVTAFWVYVFAISKVFELGDTVFIVLRKQKLTFLHMYHHVTVLAACWYIFKEQAAFGRWMVSMNYAIHAVMYSYYALKAIRVKIPRQVSMGITVVQVLQMVFGCFVSLFAMQAYMRGQQCKLTKALATFTLFLYFTYLIMFVRFFYYGYLYVCPIVSKTVKKSK